MRPLICGDGAIQPGDAVIFFNFRADRARQLARALVDPTFAEFRRVPAGCGGQGAPDLIVDHHGDDDRLRRRARLRCGISEEGCARRLRRDGFAGGLRQLRAAETEKYAHVTYFSTAERRMPGPRERLLVPSPRVPNLRLEAGDERR